MDKRFTLKAKDRAPAVSLRTISEADLEDLRAWKNANSSSFFYKHEITPEGQKKWFQGYLTRPHDYMFIVESSSARAGCMGFRIIEQAADCYNIIGAPEARGKGFLGQAMNLMCSFILGKGTPKIGCKVLKNNPAASWYQKCGFRVANEETDYYQMELDQAHFKPCAYTEDIK